MLSSAGGDRWPPGVLAESLSTVFSSCRPNSLEMDEMTDMASRLSAPHYLLLAGYFELEDTMRKKQCPIVLFSYEEKAM